MSEKMNKEKTRAALNFLDGYLSDKNDMVRHAWITLHPALRLAALYLAEEKEEKPHE